ncbi:MAG: ATP-dependent DNA ligase [Candidatus Aenigmatarchaeota archaeon]
MQYRELVKTYQSLEATTKKLEKRDILARLYKETPNELLPIIVLLSQGMVFPKGGKELGIATNMMLAAIEKSYGVSEKEVESVFKKTGDVGLTAEHFAKNKKQHSLVHRVLTVQHIMDNLQRLPDITGKGSQEKKLVLLQELLVYATPLEAKYIARTAVETLRIGVAEGVVNSAIAHAFNKEPKLVEKSYSYIGDYGEVAVLAKENKLTTSRLEVGSPVRPMLADRSKGLDEVFERFKNIALEVKYDGFRTFVHKDGNKITIFSRRLDDVTHQFPDIVKLARENLKAKSCIVDGETFATDKKTGAPRPFQVLSRRIHRKYDIEQMIQEIPIQVNLFDLLYANGENYMEKPLKERWHKLKQVVKETRAFKLAEHIETDDRKIAEKFLKESLAEGQEGLIGKNLDAHYQPGKRAGYWLKVKEIMEPLDLVIIGGTWSEGKRAKQIGSILLGVKNGKEFIATGMLGSGLREKESESTFTISELTDILKKDIVSESGTSVVVKPRIVVEVGYEEIQKSPKYPSGFALRFPRLLRFRTDEKRPEDADTIATIEKLYKKQKTKE